ncbi:MAG TPA: alpha/beta hydrolase [Candidatus Angelobacter sp.]|nr:alpha/beta hydrolase [Candidatus Angelobacter sp.]
MPEACSNGVRISYDDRGEGGPALLFLPGWCVSRKVFADLPRLGAARRRTLALDWRGHGESEAAPAPFGSNELVEDAIAVIAASGARSVVPVALSHAGWIAIELRRRLGDRIAKLVLIDWIVQEAPLPFLRVLEASQSPDRWSIARDLLFSIWLRGVDDDELKCFIPADMGAYGFEMWARAGREIEAAYRRWRSPLAALADLEARLPVLHLHARRDEAGYPADPLSFSARHPWYSVVELDARTHFPMFEAPLEMAAAIERFVAPDRRASLRERRAEETSWMNSLPL